MPYRHAVGAVTHAFADLKEVMAKATPARSGDVLAGIAAASAAERMAARMCLAGLPLSVFLNEALDPLRVRRGDAPHRRPPRCRRLWPRSAT